MPDILIVGVGGAGCNIVQNLHLIEGANYEMILIDKAENLPVGFEGSLIYNYEQLIGREARLIKHFDNARFVIVCVGLGGEIGCEAALAIASMTKFQQKINLTFATLPFTFEAAERQEKALEYLKTIGNLANTTIVFQNYQLENLDISTKEEMLDQANKLLSTSIYSIVEATNVQGLINVDFDDLQTIFKNGKYGFIGYGSAYGTDRALVATERALKSPTFITDLFRNATEVIFQVKGSSDLNLFEVNESVGLLYSKLDRAANIIFGVNINENLNNIMQVVIIAAGHKVNFDYLAPYGHKAFKHPDRETYTTNPFYPFPSSIRDSLAALHKDFDSGKKKAFIIMDFSPSKLHSEIYAEIKQILAHHDIIPLRADYKEYHDNLFNNIETYMHGCDFGIAIFERISSDRHNPNVALEVGYMLALGKKVCLLKEKTLTQLPTDVVGKIYREFDIQNIPQSVDSCLTKWLKEKL